jgi:hypothetical protein
MPILPANFAIRWRILRFLFFMVGRGWVGRHRGGLRGPDGGMGIVSILGIPFLQEKSANVWNPMNPDELGGFDAQITLKMTSNLKKKLDAMYAQNGIQPAELFRRLAFAAIEYYENTGHFSLPAKVIPEADFRLFGKTEITPSDLGKAVQSRLANLQEINDAKSRAGKESPARRHKKTQDAIRKLIADEEGPVTPGLTRSN